LGVTREDSTGFVVGGAILSNAGIGKAHLLHKPDGTLGKYLGDLKTRAAVADWLHCIQAMAEIRAAPSGEGVSPVVRNNACHAGSRCKAR
jgi:hypothetical protein